jgi:hypothetical protein
VLLDFLDVLDDFISKLPEGKESGKAAWIGAAGSAQYKTEVALGLRESDFPDNLKPLKSVQELVSGLTRGDAPKPLSGRKLAEELARVAITLLIATRVVSSESGHR